MSTGLIVILVIAALVLVAGVLVAMKGFVRGEMPTTPEEDRRERSGSQPPPDDEYEVRDPRAVGRPSDRG